MIEAAIIGQFSDPNVIMLEGVMVKGNKKLHKPNTITLQGVKRGRYMIVYG